MVYRYLSSKPADRKAIEAIAGKTPEGRSRLLSCNGKVFNVAAPGLDAKAMKSLEESCGSIHVG